MSDATLETGAAIPELRVTPDKYLPHRYAGASGDFNPIHIDREFAESVGLPQNILHGLYSMALVARVLYLGVQIYANKGSDLPTPRFTDSALTMLTVGLAGAYFGTYSAGLLRWRRKLRRAIGKP